MENGEGCCKSKVQWNSFRKFWGLEKYISTTIVSTLNINAWMIWDKILVAVELIRPVLRITQIFRLIGTTSIRKSRSRFASRKCQTQHAVAQNVLSKNCFPRHAELYHTVRRKDKPPPQKRNKSIEVFSDGIMRMLARQQVPWNQNTVNQICIPSVRVVGIDRRPRWTSKLGTWTFASSERSDTTQAWQ